MTPTLLHAVARRADALTPDADLLTRYIRERETGPCSPAGEAAFEELVRRHGPLVWAVCRQMLPVHADAEDAFQAVFLALTRCAATIRDRRTVSAWLHGVAVRVATRARRGFARRRIRERAAALAEVDRSVSDGTWDALAAAVHEEVQRLPEAERTAFVLCDLQGVSQPDAAARLGWALGSVSGRLCKARQRLLNRLTARGIAPAAAVGIGITARSASAAHGLPPALLDAVRAFSNSPAAASAVVAALARGLTEAVTMRMKWMTAAAVLVAAVGLTGTAVVLSTAEAQPPGGGGPVRGAGDPTQPGPRGAPPGGVLPGSAPPGAPADGTPPGMAPPGTPPGGASPAGGTPGSSWRGGKMGSGSGFAGDMAGAIAPTTWEYKFVDAPGDRKRFEETIVQHGKDGWEYCSSELCVTDTGAVRVLVFKKRKGDAPLIGMGGVGGLPGGEAGAKKDGPTTKWFSLKNVKAADVAGTLSDLFAESRIKFSTDPKGKVLVVTGDPATLQKLLVLIEKIIEDAEANAAEKPKTGAGPGPGAPGMGDRGTNKPGPGAMPGGRLGGVVADSKPAALNVFSLKNATAEGMVAVLKKLFPNADMTADPRTNTVIVRADEPTLEEMKMLITRLDSLETPKGR